MRPPKDETWLHVAAELSRQSTCLRRAVGCVLLDSRGHVASTGWNGVASKQPHCNEYTAWLDEEGVATYRRGYLGPMDEPPLPNQVRGGLVYGNMCEGALAPSGTSLDLCQAVHAEQNALMQCSDVYDLSTCYVTHSPCVTCTKLLMSTSCTRVVFLQAYAHDAPSRRLWESMGRGWIHHAP